MRHTLNIRIVVSIGLIASLFALVGCGHNDGKAEAPPPGTAPVGNRPTGPTDPRAQQFQAMHKQGAASDGQRAAAAMSAATKH